MSEAPERIWIEDEFGDGDDDKWTYGTWDVRNYRGYVVEYVRADLALPAVQPDRIEQLEKELSTCRMAQVVMDNTVAKLTAERDKYESAWMTAEGQLADAEAEVARLKAQVRFLERKIVS